MGGLDTIGNISDVTTNEIADSAVTNVKLANDSITINGTAVPLGGTVTTPDTNTTYSAGSGLTLSGTSFSHTDTSSQGSVNNSGTNFIQDISVDTYGHITGITSAAAGGSIPSGGVTGTVITLIGYNPGNVTLSNANPSVAGTSSAFDSASPFVRNFSGTFGGVNSGHNILTGTWRPTNSSARYGGNTFTYDTWIRVS